MRETTRCPLSYSSTKPTAGLLDHFTCTTKRCQVFAVRVTARHVRSDDGMQVEISDPPRTQNLIMAGGFELSA